MLVNVLSKFDPLKKWNPIPNSSMVTDDYVGIEVEVEHLRDFQGDFVYWLDKEDGSLRDNGREYVTHPIPADHVPLALKELKGFLDVVNPKHSFSTRTSIHVHLNVRDMSFKQLHALSLVYMLFEKAFYKFAGRDRSKNIFCVPHTDSVDYYTVAKAMELSSKEDDMSIDDLLTLRRMFDNCRRYVGFNVKCIPTYGTVEFRHLPGTMDITRITTWINLILSLKKYVMGNSYEVVVNSVTTINTTSQYEQLLSSVFGVYKDVVMYPEYVVDMYNATLFLKEAINYIPVWAIVSDIRRTTVLGSDYVKKVAEEPKTKKVKASETWSTIVDLVPLEQYAAQYGQFVQNTR